MTVLFSFVFLLLFCLLFLSLFLVLSLSPLLVASPRCWPCIIAFADVASLFFVAAVRGVAVVVFVVAAVVPLGRYVYGLVWRGAA